MAGKQETGQVIRRQALFQMIREDCIPQTIASIADRLGVDSNTVCADLARLQQPPYSDGRVLQRVRLQPGDSKRIMAAMSVCGSSGSEWSKKESLTA